MNDEQFERNLRSVGLGVFVEFYKEFSNESLSVSEVAKLLNKSKGFTENSCRSRTSHARSIIANGRGIEGLRKAAKSRRVDAALRTDALALFAQLESE